MYMTQSKETNGERKQTNPQVKNAAYWDVSPFGSFENLTYPLQDFFAPCSGYWLLLTFLARRFLSH
jgi:hypothetical protein